MRAWTSCNFVFIHQPYSVGMKKRKEEVEWIHSLQSFAVEMPPVKGSEKHMQNIWNLRRFAQNNFYLYTENIGRRLKYCHTKTSSREYVTICVFKCLKKLVIYNNVCTPTILYGSEDLSARPLVSGEDFLFCTVCTNLLQYNLGGRRWAKSNAACPDVHSFGWKKYFCEWVQRMMAMMIMMWWRWLILFYWSCKRPCKVSVNLDFFLSCCIMQAYSRQ